MCIRDRSHAGAARGASRRPRRAGPSRSRRARQHRLPPQPPGQTAGVPLSKMQSDLLRRKASAEGAGGKRKRWTEYLVPQTCRFSVPTGHLRKTAPKAPSWAAGGSGHSTQRGRAGLCAGLALAGEGPQPTTTGRAAGARRPAHAPAGSLLPCPGGSPHGAHSPATGKSQGRVGPRTFPQLPCGPAPSTVALGARWPPRCVCREAAHRLSRSGHHGHHDPGWTDCTTLTMHASRAPQDGRNARFPDGSPQSYLGQNFSNKSIAKKTAARPSSIYSSPGRGRQLHRA